MEERVTYCRICEACCGMVATVDGGGHVVKLRADRANPFSTGYVCPKGPAYLEVQNDPDRVVHPLKRQADGVSSRSRGTRRSTTSGGGCGR
jgi:formate dehydrogenase